MAEKQADPTVSQRRDTELSLSLRIPLFRGGSNKALRDGAKLSSTAALSSSDEISIYFGGRKSGKSQYVATRCIDRDICIADDLILYCNESHHFQSLGLPVSRRRPIHPSLLAKIDTSTILVGHSICYFTQCMCNMMRVGHVF